MNPSQQALLRQLADGEFHSGESLGACIGVSRAAVWKQLQLLQELGVELSSVKGLGYCIEGGLDLLHRESILKHYSGLSNNRAEDKLSDVIVETAIDSTSQALIRKSSSGESIHGLACFAESQSAGRGRRGRSWQSPVAHNLYFSIGWRIQYGVAAVEGLSLAVGVALCQALEQIGLRELELKWPNDLLYQGKKLGGILLEINGDAAGECDLVLGLGVNIQMPHSAAAGIDQAWVDLQSVQKSQGLSLSLDRNKLAATFLYHVLRLLSGYESQGFAAWRNEWQQRNAHQGKAVQLVMGRNQVCGRVEGVSENGALRLCIDNTIQEFIGGEVSLRPVT